jgi:uncharacterized damage-inducible protein DinB
MADRLGMIHGLYDYHRWANRTLFRSAEALGAEVTRDLGKHFSFPTPKGMLAHIYAADWVWLSRWKGTSPTALPGDADFPSLAALRGRWDALEAEQRAFLDGLSDADLDRVVDYRNTAGQPFRLALGPLLQHVANHATHHRSELATMITMISGSPPPTDLVVHQLRITGQQT